MKHRYLKYFLIAVVLALVIPVLLKSFLPSKLPSKMTAMYANQKNPFTVSKDSSELVWNRASEFLKKRKLIIVGGTLQINDSVIYMPYYNYYHKGTSLKIERKTMIDSVQFKVQVWNSGKPNIIGAKEIALFMNTGIDRYNKRHSTR